MTPNAPLAGAGRERDMLDAEDVERLVREGLEGAECRATDLTGTRDHWGLEVCWPGFEGLNRIERHRKVLQVLRPHMSEGSNAIHAVQIQTRTD